MQKFKEAGLVAGVVFLVMFPYIWKGQDVQVNVWDNLDSNVVWYKMLKDQDKIFAGPDVMVEGFVTETPRFSYPSGWNVELIFVYFLNVFNAYWLNKFLIILVAFFSMYSFLNIGVNGKKGLLIGLSLIWATLAFYPHRGISIAALPLVYVVFNQLRYGQKVKRGLFLIFLYGCYSMFVLAGFYLWAIFLLISSIWMIKDRTIHKYLLAGLLVWLGVYIISEYQLIYFLFIQNEFISHRKEFIYADSIWTGQYPWDFVIQGSHSGVFYWWGYPVLALVFSAIIYLKNYRRAYVLFWFTIVVSVAAWCGAISLFSFVDMVGEWIPSLHSFNLLRFTYVIPLAIFALVALGFVQLNIPEKKLLIMLCIGVNIFIYQYEWRNWLNDKMAILPYKVPTFREYYSTDLYEELKAFLGKEVDEEKFGHVNLPPAISVYNNLTAVDGYLQNYSLAYKERIRKVIIGELNKNSELSDHFNNWGNKCYLENSTYPDQFDAYKWKDLAPILELDFNYELLKKDLDVTYLLSAVEIQDKRVQLLKLFINENSAWDIYLYKIN